MHRTFDAATLEKNVIAYPVVEPAYVPTTRPWREEKKQRIIEYFLILNASFVVVSNSKSSMLMNTMRKYDIIR